MASLTQTAIITRKAVRYSIYFIIILIIGRLSLGIIISIATKLFPAPPPTPTVQFGKLPILPFPKSDNTSALSYTIQTPDGGLPALITQAKVYYMPSQRPDLLSLDNTKQKASSLGFSGTANQQTPTLYQFNSTNGLSSLTINIVTGTFSIGYKLNEDSSPLDGQPPTAATAADSAKGFMSSAGVLPDDLTGAVTPEYLKIQNKQLVSAISLSEANFTKVNFFRRDYDKIPAKTPKPDQANVWFVLGGGQNQGKQVIGAQYWYYPIDITQFATYPLKTADVAFKELQAGKGYIANIGDNTNGKITITNVYLGYYDPGIQTQFYQPIIVFEGSNNFVAYVPAVTSTYYSE
ncbi:hypothetical protein BH10PAT1_BH10PAT1_4760 [soil metagenome]